MATMRDDKTRDLDRLTIGDAVWVLDHSSLLYEGTIERDGNSFTYRDGTTRLLGYHVRLWDRYRGGDLEFFSRSQIFRRPSELRELIERAEEDRDRAESLLSDLQGQLTEPTHDALED